MINIQYAGGKRMMNDMNVIWMKMGRSIGQIGGKQEKNDTKEVKGCQSLKEGMVNGSKYWRDQINKVWNIHSTWLFGGPWVRPFYCSGGTVGWRLNTEERMRNDRVDMDLYKAWLWDTRNHWAGSFGERERELTRALLPAVYNVGSELI